MARKPSGPDEVTRARIRARVRESLDRLRDPEMRELQAAAYRAVDTLIAHRVYGMEYMHGRPGGITPGEDRAYVKELRRLRDELEDAVARCAHRLCGVVGFEDVSYEELKASVQFFHDAIEKRETDKPEEP